MEETGTSKLLKFPDDTMVETSEAEKPFGFFTIQKLEKINMEPENRINL